MIAPIASTSALPVSIAMRGASPAIVRTATAVACQAATGKPNFSSAASRSMRAALNPMPAAKTYGRPSAVASEIARVAWRRSRSAMWAAAAVGLSGTPSVRASTFVKPPGTTASGTPVPRRPRAAALTVPSPP